MLRTAVIGVGYLGRFHAQKYAHAANCDLVAVSDIEIDQVMAVAEECHTEYVNDYRELIGQVDAVSIVTPTPLHHEVAAFFLKHGVHVLIEKPIASTLAEATELVQLGQQHNAVLQVGHLERFNNAFTAAQPFIKAPCFINCQRISPFKLRGSDVSVILDLMIHDIDLVHALVPHPITRIDAIGRQVVSNTIDIANARLHFANGCIANLTASRVDLTSTREMTVYQPDSQLRIDLADKTIQRHAVGQAESFPGIPEIIGESFHYDQGDALRDQIDHFLQCISQQTSPRASGQAGLDALRVAEQIAHAISQNPSIDVTDYEQQTT